MKTFKSHKTVEAAKITAISFDGTRYIIGCDDGPHDIDQKVFARGVPSHGDYLIKYRDGYISWSPAKEFEDGYTEQPAVTSEPAHLEGWHYVGLNFGEALVALKAGHRVARQGWNGKGMFVFLVPGSRFTVNRAPLLGIYPEGTVIDYHAHIDMRTAQGTIVPWLASQTDVLADDWVMLT